MGKVTVKHKLKPLEATNPGIVKAISEHNFEKASPEETYDFIQSLSLQLAKIALQTRNDLLVYLFTMAAQEAGDEKLRHSQPCAATAV